MIVFETSINTCSSLARLNCHVSCKRYLNHHRITNNHLLDVGMTGSAVAGGHTPESIARQGLKKDWDKPLFLNRIFQQIPGHPFWITWLLCYESGYLLSCGNVWCSEVSWKRKMWQSSGFCPLGLDDFLEKNLSQVNDHAYFFAKKIGGGINPKIGDTWWYVQLLPCETSCLCWRRNWGEACYECYTARLYKFHIQPGSNVGSLDFFIWMLKYLCHLYPKDPCEYHRSCCEGEAISPNKCCDFCRPTFLNSQAKGAPPAPSAPPVVCDLALRRCPWFSGDSAAFRRFHRFQLRWLGHSKRRRHGWTRTWHAWLGSQEKDCYMAYNISKTTREEMLGFCRQDCSKIEEKQNNEKQ